MYVCIYIYLSLFSPLPSVLLASLSMLELQGFPHARQAHYQLSCSLGLKLRALKPQMAANKLLITIVASSIFCLMWPLGHKLENRQVSMFLWQF